MSFLSKEEARKLLGDPRTLLNVGDFLVIGLFAVTFLFLMHIAGMSWHRIQLLRVTGSAKSITGSNPLAKGPVTIDPNASVPMENTNNG